MALRRGSSPWDVVLWARREAAVAPVSFLLPGCRVTSDLAAAVEGADIVVLCTSPRAIEESGEILSKLLAPTTVVTDAGSVKRRIVSALERTLGGRFIGAHPMAGSEQSGISAARPDLFDGALCLLTPTAASSPDALEKVRQLWSDAGCELREMSAVAHDGAVARLSHLPHAAAAALVHAATQGGALSSALAGNGYRDSTRVAGGPEGLWAEILLDNVNEIEPAITDLQSALGELKSALMRGDRSAVEGFLAMARSLRSNENIPKA